MDAGNARSFKAPLNKPAQTRKRPTASSASAFPLAEHAVLRAAVIGVHHAHAADQHGHFRRRQAH